MACELHHSKDRLARWLSDSANDKPRSKASQVQSQQCISTSAKTRTRSGPSPFRSIQGRGGRECGNANRRHTSPTTLNGQHVVQKSGREVQAYAREVELEVARRTGDTERLRESAEDVRSELRIVAAKAETAAADRLVLQRGLVQDLQISMRNCASIAMDLHELEARISEIVRLSEVATAQRSAAVTSADADYQFQVTFRARLAREVEVCAQLRSDLLAGGVRETNVSDQLVAVRHDSGQLRTERTCLDLISRDRANAEFRFGIAVSHHLACLLRMSLQGLRLWRDLQIHRLGTAILWMKGRCLTNGSLRDAVASFLSNVLEGWQYAAVLNQQHVAVAIFGAMPFEWKSRSMHRTILPGRVARLKRFCWLSKDVIQAWAGVAVGACDQQGDMVLLFSMHVQFRRWYLHMLTLRNDRAQLKYRAALDERISFFIIFRAWRSSAHKQKRTTCTSRCVSRLVRLRAIRRAMVKLSMHSCSRGTLSLRWRAMCFRLQLRLLVQQQFASWRRVSAGNQRRLKLAVRFLPHGMLKNIWSRSISIIINVWLESNSRAADLRQQKVSVRLRQQRARCLRKSLMVLLLSSQNERKLQAACVAAKLRLSSFALRRWLYHTHLRRRIATSQIRVRHMASRERRSLLAVVVAAWVRRCTKGKRRKALTDAFAHRLRLQLCRWTLGIWLLADWRQLKSTETRSAVDATLGRCTEITTLLHAVSPTLAQDIDVESSRLLAQLQERRSEAEQLVESVAAESAGATTWQAVLEERRREVRAEAAVLDDVRRCLPTARSTRDRETTRLLDEEHANVRALEANLRISIQRSVQRRAACAVNVAANRRSCSIFREQFAFASAQHAAALVTLGAELGRLQAERQELWAAEEVLRRELSDVTDALRNADRICGL